MAPLSVGQAQLQHAEKAQRHQIRKGAMTSVPNRDGARTGANGVRGSRASMPNDSQRHGTSQDETG